MNKFDENQKKHDFHHKYLLLFTTILKHFNYYYYMTPLTTILILGLAGLFCFWLFFKCIDFFENI